MCRRSMVCTARTDHVSSHSESRLTFRPSRGGPSLVQMSNETTHQSFRFYSWRLGIPARSLQCCQCAFRVSSDLDNQNSRRKCFSTGLAQVRTSTLPDFRDARLGGECSDLGLQLNTRDWLDWYHFLKLSSTFFLPSHRQSISESRSCAPLAIPSLEPA